MGQLLLFIVVALVVAAIVFGVTVMIGGGDNALTPVEPDGSAVPLPSDRPLGEEDISRTKFDTAWRGYRMSQVDQALQRAAYDIGYKGELIGVLEAEVVALREGRTADADVLRRAREAAIAPSETPEAVPAPGDLAISVTAAPADSQPASTPGSVPASTPGSVPAPVPASVPDDAPAAPAQSLPADATAARNEPVER